MTMSDMQILHNNRCRKSRETLSLITEKGINPTIVEYLKGDLNKKELTGILKKLKMKPLEIIRKSEKLYKENYKGQELSDEAWIDIMIEYPILIERPIVIKGNKAIIGRPPENVLELL